ncbi:MAG TPA: hypothetical protein RMH99_22290 [Sandaracinaceae bacterium LLY-WYZ-13_1]|nr:hypothetical protein [Sandaracinaceae bacterium LLY-WYZ-13_1]
MLKRLGLGLLKGLIIGGAVGAGLQYGLAWTIDPSQVLLGFLVAMGAAGTAGVFAGKPPWLEGAWIEATLKGMVGVGLGALAYWGLTYVPFELPFPGLEGTHAPSALPAVFAPAIAGLYGALVELDNTGDDESSSSGPKARVAVDDAEEVAVASSSGRKAKKKRKA